MKRKGDLYSAHTSLIVASVKRLVPVGLGACFPCDQSFILLAKNGYSQVSWKCGKYGQISSFGKNSSIVYLIFTIIVLYRKTLRMTSESKFSIAFHIFRKRSVIILFFVFHSVV